MSVLPYRRFVTTDRRCDHRLEKVNAKAVTESSRLNHAGLSQDFSQPRDAEDATSAGDAIAAKLAAGGWELPVPFPNVPPG
jgi:hypothetical protein